MHTYTHANMRTCLLIYIINTYKQIFLVFIITTAGLSKHYWIHFLELKYNLKNEYLKIINIFSVDDTSNIENSEFFCMEGTSIMYWIPLFWIFSAAKIFSKWWIKILIVGNWLNMCL